MNKKLKVFLLIIGITTFILTFLWLASFAHSFQRKSRTKSPGT